jgi:hypothetical protein
MPVALTVSSVEVTRRSAGYWSTGRDERGEHNQWQHQASQAADTLQAASPRA